MLDESELRHLYLDEQRSIRDIATLLQVSQATVYNALNHYGIPRRPAGFRSPHANPITAQLDAATLRRLYVDEQRSGSAIAELYQVSPSIIYAALRRYRIPRRLRDGAATHTDLVFDEATLRRLYIDQQQTIGEIAALFGCARSRVYTALVNWGIPRRSQGRTGSEPD